MAKIMLEGDPDWYFYIDSGFMYGHGDVVIPLENLYKKGLLQKVRAWCGKHLMFFLAVQEVEDSYSRASGNGNYWSWERMKRELSNETLHMALKSEYLTNDWREWIEILLSNYKNPYEKPPEIIKQNQICEGFVYVLRAENDVYKIGKAKDLDNRIYTFEVKLPIKVELYCSCKVENYSQLEKELHIKYAEKRINGEWFSLTEQDLEEIKALMGVS